MKIDIDEIKIFEIKMQFDKTEKQISGGFQTKFRWVSPHSNLHNSLLQLRYTNICNMIFGLTLGLE